MSTKNNKYPFIGQNVTTSENQYCNLNINQYKKCPILLPVQSNSKSNNDKYCGKKHCCCSPKINICFMLKNWAASTDFIVSDNYEEKEKSQSWNKSFKLSTFTTLNENNLEKRWKNKNILNTTNKCTLSLHISVNENSTGAVASDENIDGLKKEKLKSIKTYKKCITDSYKPQNPLEFSRQQNENQRNEPQIMPFSVTQRLLNPDQSMADGEISLEDLLILEKMEEEEMEVLQLLKNMLIMLEIQANEARLLALEALEALEAVDSIEVIPEPR